MRNIKLIFVLCLTLGLLSSCEEKEVTYNFNGVSAPSDLNAIFEMNADNPGQISVTPSGSNVGSYAVFFGDVAGEEATIVAPGETITHMYEENGEYVLRIVATGVTGLTSELSRIITVDGEDTTVIPDDMEPENSAPIPTAAAADVISLFSDAYTDVEIATWRTDWSDATLEDVTVDGGAVRKYSALNVVGIESPNPYIDASTMTHFHIDVWSADFTEFKIKLVDFGANAAFDGVGAGDDVEHELVFEAPEQGEWISYDIPLSDFTGLTTTANIAQLILVGAPTGNNTIFIDNVYFYGSGGSGTTSEPSVAAPAPTVPEADVISLFSDAYTDVEIASWRTDWSSATLEDVTVDGGAAKKYSELDVVGIESPNPYIDASAMTHFHIDVWSADFTEFKIKLVDFGANAAFDGVGVGDDVEHELVFEAPAQGEWIGYDIPLSDFTGLTTTANIAQLILVGAPTGNNTIFIDNVYFYGSGGSGTTSEPSVAAPAPTVPEADVISLFSDAYTDVEIASWRTDWSSATLEDVTVDGGAAKKYSELDVVGIESPNPYIDASTMTHFHIDVWSADFTEFKIKLVDFGANAAFDGVGVGDDVEHELVFEAPAQGEWISYDIPLSDFTGLTTTANIAQLILVGSPTGSTTVFVDNVYFHN